MTQHLKPVAIERYHLLDSNRRHPNCIIGRFHFDGEMDLSLAEKALSDMLDQHPMVQCIYDKDSDRWVRQSDNRPVFHVSETWPPVAKDFDIEKSVANRFSFHVSNGKTYLQTQTHHALLDGLAGLLCVGDFLVRYARLQTGEEVGNIRDLDPALLTRRGKLNLLNRDMIVKFPLQGVALFGATKFMLRSVEPIRKLETQKSDQRLPDAFPLMLTRLIEPGTNRRLKERAKKLNASLVELLLTEWFIAQIKWRQENGLHDDRDWMRVIVPMNIRTRQDLNQSACNRVSMIQLDRRLKDTQQYEKLIAGIKKELGVIRQWNLDRTFLLAIKMFSWIPGMLKRILHKDVCRATSVFSSLGNPFKQTRLPMENGKFRAGNLLLDHFELGVPVRSQTGVTMATSRYANRLQLTMHADPDVLNEEQANELFDAFISRLDADQT